LSVHSPRIIRITQKEKKVNARTLQNQPVLPDSRMVDGKRKGMFKDHEGEHRGFYDLPFLFLARPFFSRCSPSLQLCSGPGRMAKAGDPASGPEQIFRYPHSFSQREWIMGEWTMENERRRTPGVQNPVLSIFNFSLSIPPKEALIYSIENAPASLALPTKLINISR
jgi:hypothetical protein